MPSSVNLSVPSEKTRHDLAREVKDQAFKIYHEINIVDDAMNLSQKQVEEFNRNVDLLTEKLLLGKKIFVEFLSKNIQRN